MKAEVIRVRGLVQGVGFRPHVWQLAKQFQICGDVINDGNGVLIQAWGNAQQLDDFCEQIVASAPPLSRIESLQREPLVGLENPADFKIKASEASPANTGIVPDAATCPECIDEIFDPANRRYRYPFTNCTHCGPRLTIIKGIPYDRANTSMAAFKLCTACRQEYENPADRRFHAQPNACPDCGPQVWLENPQGEKLHADALQAVDAIDAASKLLKQGHILAIKGIGGFHLACDATNDAAVKRLREKKHRYQKPFALMAKNLDIIANYVELSDNDRINLSAREAPILLLPALSGSAGLAEQVAPQQHYLGFMLPYSPLHHLLLNAWQTPLVMTSGNLVDEPQCTDNEIARKELGRIADYLLLHDRPIVNRVDDSVLRPTGQAITLLRRARGYAPAPLQLPDSLQHDECVLAMGSELKNTFCLAEQGKAIPSQHLGDLTDVKTANDYQQTLSLYLDLYQTKPQVIAIDLHPGYQASQLGKKLSQEQNLPLLEIQHHHAHIAAVMADNDYAMEDGPVLGIALDGLGFGDDGALWGGEFLLTDYSSYERLGHIDYCPLPGGSAAIKSPWRYAYAQLRNNLGKDWLTQYPELKFSQWLQTQPLQIIDAMLDKQLNTPQTSSCGRLFDAVSAVLGLCEESISYEGQAAINLENHASCADPNEPGYVFQIDSKTPTLILKTSHLWQQLLADLQQEENTETIAMRFHRGLAAAVVDMAEQLCFRHHLQTVALSGGVFQNQLFTRLVANMLKNSTLTTLLHRSVPANDGGLSLGQAAITIASRKS